MECQSLFSVQNQKCILKCHLQIFNLFWSRDPQKGNWQTDPDQMPQNAASDQVLHCLQILQLFFSKNISIKYVDIPKTEIGIFQYIMWGEFILSEMG